MAQLRRFIVLISILLMSSSVFANDWIYTVRPGDNLTELSKKYLLDQAHLIKLQQLNNITKPASLSPGTVIRFPIEWLKIQPSSALVVDGRGDVTIVRSSSTNINANATDVRLYVGDRISTGAKSSAMLIFADKSRLLLQSNSELIMDKLSVFGDGSMADTRLRLPAGRVDAHIIPRSRNRSRYEITTPAAVAAVRGTEFRVSAEKAKPIARSEVLKGLVAVGNNGISNNIPAGFGSVSEAGKPPQKPKKLLPAPSINDKHSLYTHIPIAFSWKPVKGALQYRIQLFNKNNLNILLLDEVITKNEYIFKELADDGYMLRVRSIDNDKLEGLNSDHVFTVNALPGISLLKMPNNNKVTHSQRPEFSWSTSKAALKYRFQVATAADFSSLVIDQSGLVETTFQVKSKLEAGKYFWRVAGIDDGGRGAYSRISHFIVQPILPIPQIKSPDIDEKNIHFEWDEVLSGVEYHFQFSYDLDENNKDEYRTMVVNKTSLTLPHPYSGNYYYRIKAATHDNSYAPSEYSAWKKVEVAVETDLPWYMLIVFLFLL